MLHPYQLKAVDHILKVPYCGLFLDMGLGKTVSTLTAVNVLLYSELDIYSAVVVAPKRVAESVWSTEVEKWPHLNHIKISKVIGTEKQRLKAMSTEADMYTLGRDNTEWFFNNISKSKRPIDMLIIDESSSFKNQSSKRFKALRKKLHLFKRVVILTGTPTPNGLLDLWPQIYLLDKGQRLGNTVTAYRNAYFTPGKRNGDIIYSWNLRPEAESQIQNMISDICISMKAEDYLDLPVRVDNEILINLDRPVLKKYRELENQLLFEIEGLYDISSPTAATLRNKLLQFCNGAVYDTDRKWHEIHSHKLDVCEEIIDNANGKPVLVAYSYQHDLSRLLLKLKKYDPVKFNSEAHITQWNNGEIRVMLMHPASAGHGLNLQAGGNIIVWFGLPDSLELYQQFNARLHRQGQKCSVIINHLLIKDTVETEVVKALIGKANVQDSLIKALKSKVK